MLLLVLYFYFIHVYPYPHLLLMKFFIYKLLYFLYKLLMHSEYESFVKCMPWKSLHLFFFNLLWCLLPHTYFNFYIIQLNFSSMECAFYCLKNFFIPRSWRHSSLLNSRVLIASLICLLLESLSGKKIYLSLKLDSFAHLSGKKHTKSRSLY